MIQNISQDIPPNEHALMQNDEQAIRDLLAKWHAATAIGDLDQLLGLMTDDVIFLTPGNPPMRGKDAFATNFKKALQKFRINSSSEIQEIQVLADYAFCWTQLLVTMTPLQPGPPIHRSGHTLTIFRKQTDGAWALARDANMLTVISRLVPE